MKVLWSSEQVAASIETSRELLERLANAEPELRARSYDPGPGFPATSFGGGSSRNGHGDPVGEMVVHGGLTDPVRDAHALVLQTIRTVQLSLTDAVNAFERTRANEDAKARNDIDDLWCTSCERAKEVHEPKMDTERLGAFGRKYGGPLAKIAEAKGLCWFCAEWAAVNDGQLPPANVLEARARGVRLTSRVLDQLQAPRKKKRTKARR